MDANIKTAAGYLRKAISDIERRIKDIRAHEHNEERSEHHEEELIREQLHKTEADIVFSDTQGRGNLDLVKRAYNLHKQRQHIREDTKRHIEAENQEIRALQGQISKLDSLARTLENWR